MYSCNVRGYVSTGVWYVLIQKLPYIYILTDYLYYACTCWESYIQVYEYARHGTKAYIVDIIEVIEDLENQN